VPDVTEADFLQETRNSYNALAAAYAERYRGELAPRALDRGVLGAFAELVLGRVGNSTTVADVGCGPGRVTALLSSLGVDAFGVDLSPAMIEMARRDYPELRFKVGSMLELDIPAGSLGGVLAWYSTIHVPDDRLPDAFAEFRRVLVPGGYLLLGFQVGDTVLHRTEGLGQPVSVDFHQRQPDWVAAVLKQAGFAMYATVVREADSIGEFTENTPQAFLLARLPL
jgi:SAM-dependent methyltransferase